MSENERRRKDWSKFASDYFATKLLNTSGAAAPIAHLTWQAVENDMKALVGHSIPNTHNLGHIMDHLRDSHVLTLTELTQLSSDMAIVSGSRTYNDARYPENNPNYWYDLPRNKVADVVFAAESIHKFTQDKIGAQAWQPHKSADSERKAKSAT